MGVRAVGVPRRRPVVSGLALPRCHPDYGLLRQGEERSRPAHTPPWGRGCRGGSGSERRSPHSLSLPPFFRGLGGQVEVGVLCVRPARLPRVTHWPARRHTHGRPDTKDTPHPTPHTHTAPSSTSFPIIATLPPGSPIYPPPSRPPSATAPKGTSSRLAYTPGPTIHVLTIHVLPETSPSHPSFQWVWASHPLASPISHPYLYPISLPPYPYSHCSTHANIFRSVPSLTPTHTTLPSQWSEDRSSSSGHQPVIYRSLCPLPTPLTPLSEWEGHGDADRTLSSGYLLRSLSRPPTEGLPVLVTPTPSYQPLKPCRGPLAS